jgi:hypothetical protein
MMNPGDALFRDGIPVPDPMTINSANAFTPLEIMPRYSAAGSNAPLEFLTGFTPLIDK